MSGCGLRIFLAKVLASVMVGLCLGGFIYSCTTVPVTERSQANLIPDSQMNAMGVEAFKEVLAKEKISSNPTLIEMVTRIGKRIANASGENFSWEFKVIENAKTVNAFCLPGGKVAVYTGILPVAKNEAALAAVMGHEVAHAVARHGAERMTQQLALTGGLMVLDTTLLKDNKYRALIIGALGVGANFGVMLPYSRVHEAEADRIGLMYMAKAGYDPREAPELWLRMAKLGGAAPPEFMSTHPDPVKRSEALRSRIAEVMPQYEQSAKQPSTQINI